jgi:hypothetical protein
MRRLGLVLAILLWAAPAWAATYYVRTDGANANWPCTVNTAGGACLTIDYVADRVTAGDTIRVQAGTYAETVTPGVNGTSTSAMVTFVADGAVTVTGWDLTNNSYLRIIGFTVDSNGTRYGCVLITGTNSYLELWNNTLTDALYQGIRTTGTLSNSIIVGNTAHTLGIGNYGGTGFSVTGNDNVFAYNTTTNIDPDAFLMEGTRSYLLNNYSYGMLEQGGGHPDFFQNGTAGAVWTYNTVEGNFQLGAGTPNDHTVNIENPSGTMTENIWRRNVAHNLGSGGGVHNIAAGFTRFRYYHNTEVDTCLLAGVGSGYGSWALWGTGLNYTHARNNIFSQTWREALTSGIAVFSIEAGTYDMDYNLAYDPDDAVTFGVPFSTQVHQQSDINPQFNGYASDDFTLAGASPAVGWAGALTTTSGSGTGTTFNVATGGGGFFRGNNTAISQYGGALVKGDTITVGTDVVEVVSISGDSLTVTPSFTWANLDPVYYGSDSTPDLGAYPYKAGGYTLTATYSSSGGTTTITPNDATLVRFAVCYSDGVPVTVDNSSPYTCATPSGTVSVRVYPLYASKTLWADATGVAPAAPANVRIR